MAASAHVKKGDTVTVISGHESIKGKSGKVLQVFPKKGRIVIEGLRMIKKHQKASQTSQQGGIVEREGTIHLSKVKLSGDSAKEKKAPAAKAKPAKAKTAKAKTK